MVEPANKAMQIWREGIDFRKIGIQGIIPTARCLHLTSKFSECVLSKGLNLLDHDTVRANCDTTEWRTQCPGTIRRLQFEKLYRKTINRRLYTQDELNKYMQSKNNIHHFGIVDGRY